MQLQTEYFIVKLFLCYIGHWIKKLYILGLNLDSLKLCGSPCNNFIHVGTMWM